MNTSISKKIAEITEQTPTQDDNNFKKNLKNIAKQFVRVGDDYYRIVQKPDKYGNLNEAYQPIKKSTITDDYGRDILKLIPKYYGFCTVPSHLNYKQEVSGFLNKYYKIEWDIKPGDWSTTQKFLKHIFGDYYDLGLDYLAIMWKYPEKRLPILALVSKERSTGKTTFLQWLRLIYGNNMIIVGNNQLESEFNDFMVGKLIIGVDETFLEKKAVIERIKRLATDDRMPVNGKFKNLDEVDNFMKFILTSNNITNFITADKEENRYFVLEIPKPKTEIANLKQQLKKEIPAFLNFLTQYEIKTQEKTRFWFAYKDYETDAFRRIVEASKPKAQKILEDNLRSIFIETGADKLMYSVKTLKRLFFAEYKRFDESYLKTLLENLGIEKYKTGDKYTQKRHDIYYIDLAGNLQTEQAKDYPYIFYPDSLDLKLENYQKDPDAPF